MKSSLGLMVFVLALQATTAAGASSGTMITNTSITNCWIGLRDTDYSDEIKSSPDDPKLYLKRAGYDACHFKWDDALRDYSEAIRLDPTMASAYNQRGSMYYATGQFALALQDHIRAVELVPEDKLSTDDAVMYMNLGIDYAAVNRTVLATLEFNKAMQLDPHNPAAVYDRGLSYFDRREYRRALSDLTAAILMNPIFVADAHEARADAYRMYGTPSLAIADYDFVLRKEKRSAHAYAGRCWAKALANTELEGALDDCNEALQLEPSLREARDGRAFAELRLGRNADAISDYNASLQRAPQDPRALYGRALAEKASGNLTDAQKDSDDAMKGDPRVAYYYELNFKGLTYSDPP